MHIGAMTDMKQRGRNTTIAHLIRPFGSAAGLTCLTSLARKHEQPRERSVLVNVPREFAVDDGNEYAETATGEQNTQGQPVTRSGPLVKMNPQAASQTKRAWARTPPDQNYSNRKHGRAALESNRHWRGDLHQ